MSDREEGKSEAVAAVEGTGSDRSELFMRIFYDEEIRKFQQECVEKYSKVDVAEENLKNAEQKYQQRLCDKLVGLDCKRNALLKLSQAEVNKKEEISFYLVDGEKKYEWIEGKYAPSVEEVLRMDLELEGSSDRMPLSLEGSSDRMALLRT